MPFGNITVGMHQDTMHLGSAKRDALEGLAGIDAGGYVISPGLGLALKRDVTDLIQLKDRTSGDVFLKVTRIGTQDFNLQTHSGGVLADILNETDADIIGGYPSITPATTLAPIFTLPIYSHIDFSGGVANPFVVTNVMGSGTVTNYTLYAGVAIQSGTTNPSYAVYESSNKYAIDTHRNIFNGYLAYMDVGAGGNRDIYFGYKNGFNSLDYFHCIMIHIAGDGVTKFITGNGADHTETTISDVVTGDLISIVLEPGVCYAYINGSLVATHTTDLTSSTDLRVGSCVHCSGAVSTQIYSIINGFVAVRML